MPLAPAAGALPASFRSARAALLVGFSSVVLACTAPPVAVTPTPTSIPSPSAVPASGSPSPPSSRPASIEPSPSADVTSGPGTTPSATASGSPLVSPSPNGIVGTFLEVIRDDLSEPRSGFPTVDDETQRVTYDEGTLRLDLKLPGRATWTMREFGDWPLADVEGSFELEEDPGTGFFGLTCGVDPDDYYAGVITTDGTALLLRVDDGVATRLAQQFSAVTPPTVGASLRLELACVGIDAGGTTGVTLSSAGRVLAAAVDSTGFLSLRRAGFYAESAPESDRFSVRADDFVVTVGLLAGPSAGPSPSPSLTGDPDADALAAHVPESLRAACRKVVLPAFDAATAIDCPSADVPMAFYLEYASETAMEEDYSQLLDAHPESTGAECSVGPGEGPYTVDLVEVGRLLCFSSYGASFVWTDTRIDVMGYARHADGSFPDLYDWWLEAGPIP